MKIIKGNVDLSGLFLKELPEWLEDVIIIGNFDYSNHNLTSLKDIPKVIETTTTAP